MRGPHATLRRFAVMAGSLAFAVTLSLVSSAETGDAIRIWVVGSYQNVSFVLTWRPRLDQAASH